MARLEHANLMVKEIQPTLDFLLNAFPQWRVRGEGKNTWGSTHRNWVHVGDDDYYLTLNDGAQGDIRDTEGITPGLAHLGFVVNELPALIERLTAKGYAIQFLGADHPHRKTAYFMDPAGFQFEFMQYGSNEPAERNMYGGETGSITRLKKQ